TLYLTNERGSLFKLKQGVFNLLQSEGGWTQPSPSSDGKRLVIVRRSGFHSDLYLLDQDGQEVAQMLGNAGRYIDQNHWAFYPRLTGDGQKIFFSYDSPKGGYEVDLSIWALPVGGSISQARRWTDGTSYTGGDVEPIPLGSGGMIYTSFDFAPDGTVHPQIWVMPRPFTQGTALTSMDDACSQPALSPDGTRLAMICTGGKQTSRLVVAQFTGSSLTGVQVLLDGQLVARPTWAPDGSGLAFLAPELPEGLFQLWWLSTAAAQTPPAPVQLTIGYDFDATSTIAWIG
ncbi:MAG TPA: hypothetical protein VK131_03275, partial [Candidatus Acidoferrales bacterium]|nr:hypothetical protein [Candidatus Acidoferrales bacterium]